MDEKDKAEIGELMRSTLRSEFKDLFLDTFEPFTTSIQQQFQKIAGDFQKLNQRLDSIEARLGRLEQRVDKLETQVSHISRRLDNIDTTLMDLRIAGRDEGTELQLLKDRVAELEDRLARLEAGRHG
jgi:predicted  nucleic acid-binding Zn-ribbon protein